MQSHVKVLRHNFHKVQCFLQKRDFFQIHSSKYELLDQIISGFFMHVFYVHKIVANKKCPRKKAPSFLSKVITKRGPPHDDLGLILRLINSVRRVKYQSRMCREQPNLCIIVVKLRTTF